MTDNRTAADIGNIVIQPDLTTEEMYAALVRKMLWKAVDRYNLGDDFVKQVDIRFTIKGRTAGRAGKECGRYYLDFNVQAMNKYWDEMVNVTIPHEVAHLVAFAEPSLRASGHNKNWKRIDIALGGNGSRTHTMGLKRARKTKWYIYEVAGERIAISAVRHNRMLSNTTSYNLNLITGNHKFTVEQFTGEVVVKD